MGLGAKFVQDIAPKYNKSELVVTGYDVSSSGCTLCLPGGTTGLEGPCSYYTYSLQVANDYSAYINNTFITENALRRYYCGNDPNRLREDASKDYPLGSRTPIFYRMHHPKEWTLSLSALDPYSPWSAMPFTAGTIAVLAGLGAVAWEKHRRKYGQVYHALVVQTE